MHKLPVKFTLDNAIVAFIILVILGIAIPNFVAYKQYEAKYDVACANYDSQTCVNFLFNMNDK